MILRRERADDFMVQKKDVYPYLLNILDRGKTFIALGGERERERERENEREGGL